MADKMMDPKAAAAYLGTTPATLATYRCRKTIDLPYYKVNSAVRYRKSDLDAFLARCRVDEVKEVMRLDR